MKASVQPWKRYAFYFRDEKKRLFLGLTCITGRGLLLAALVIVLRRIVDDFTHANWLSQSVGDAALALFLAAMGSLCAWGARKAITFATKTVIADIRRDLHKKIYSLAVDTIERDSRMSVHTTIVHDTELLDRMTNAVLAVMVPAAFSISVLIGVLLWVAPLFGTGCLFIMALIWFAEQWARPSMRRRTDIFHQAFAAFGKGTLESIERLELARVSAAEKHELTRRARETEDLRHTSSAMVEYAAAITELRGLLGNVATMALLMIGGIANSMGLIAVPNLLTVFIILILIRGQLAGISAYTSDIQEGLASLSQIWALFDLDEETSYTGTRAISFQGGLRLENVAFGYGDAPLLKAVNMEIKAGRCVGLSGANGAGKTTLVRLMLGLYRPGQGHVFADDVAYEELDMAALRRQMGVVPQFPLLFDGTIAENIAYGHTEAAKADLERAAILAGANEFISCLSAGYETRIGDTGALLSGGERQRIAIARALVGTPRLLVLDEPLNHLAPSALGPILTRLRALAAMPSILLVSHNMEAISLADTHYLLQNGQLLEDAPGARCSQV